MDVSDGLNRVGMKKDALFLAYFGDLGNGLHRSYLIVRGHDGYKRRIVANSLFELLGADNAVFVNRQKGYFKALFFQCIKRMEYGVMLEGG